MKKKILYIVPLLVIGLVVTVVFLMSNNNMSKLKGSLSEIENGLSLTCDNHNLGVNETTTCNVSVNTGTYRIMAFQGALNTSPNLSISNIQKKEGWETQNPNLTNLFYYRTGSFAPGVVPIVSFDVTALSEGLGTISIAKLNNELFVSHDDGNLGTILYLNEKRTSITIGDSSETVASDDATLKHLYVNNNDVLDTLSYSVGNNVTSVLINPEKNDINASVTGGGAVQLNEGYNSFNITVTAENNITSNTFILNVYREPSGDLSEDYLSSLLISPGSLNETFNSTKYVYTATVDTDVSSVTIEGTAKKSTSTITGLGNHDLDIGDNYIVVTVTSSDNVINTYTIIVSRPESSIDPDEQDDPTPKSNDATVKSITVDGLEVDLNTLTTEVEYENNDYVEVIVTPNSDKAIAKGDLGSQLLKVGDNLLNIFVEAEDDTRNEFVLKIVRKDKVTPEIDPENPEETIVCPLSSSVYNIDNVNLKITKVPIEDDAKTIINNINTACGTIIVSNEKVILQYQDQTRKYLIDRVWYPNTGNNVINYWLILGIVLSLVGAGITVKIILDKKKKDI